MSVGAVNKQTGDRIPTAGMPAIDNALDLTSVNPVQNAIITAALANKQDKTDNNLETTSKTVVGAVNELKSGLTNVQSDVKLNTQDLTTASRSKNLLNANIAEAKANNTTGTWDGNSYTESGVTFACTVNSDGYITNVHVTGTATALVSFSLTKTFNLKEDGSYLLNGCPSGGTQSKYRVTIYTSVMDTQSTYGTDKDFTFKAGNNPNAYIRVYSGYKCPADGLDFTPMVRLTTETDPTFAPYIPSVDARLDAVERNTIYTKDTGNIDLSALTFTQTSSGIYYAFVDNVFPDGAYIMGAVLYAWKNIKAENIFMFSQGESDKTKFVILTGSNAFSSNAGISVRVLYRVN